MTPMTATGAPAEPTFPGSRPGADGELTIDELSARAGMTVRTVRSHIGRRLLPPPRLRGRTAYYGEDHLARLELIATLQREGFNLAAIERLLRAVPAESAEQALAFHRTLLSPWLREEPLEITHRELGRMIGLPVEPVVLDRLGQIGAIEPLGEDRVRVVNPSLFRAGLQVIRLGIPPAAVMDVEPKMRPHVRAVAETFVHLFRETVWREMLAAGLKPDHLERAADAVRELQPVAAQALLALFQQEMTKGARRRARRAPDRSRSGRGSALVIASGCWCSGQATIAASSAASPSCESWMSWTMLGTNVHVTSLPGSCSRRSW